MLHQNVQPRSGPSAALYVVGALVIVAGFVVGGLQCVQGFSALDGWLTRVTVPGTEAITLDEPGTYTIYHEHETILDGELYSSADAHPGELDYALTNKATGEAVALSVPTMDETYTFMQRQGAAIMLFTIEAPGDYELTATYRDGRTEPRLVLAIGRSVLKRVFAWMVKSFAFVGTGIIVGVVIIVVTAIGRSRARRPTYPPYPPQQTMVPPPPPGGGLR
jgi:hypothetical protein